MKKLMIQNRVFKKLSAMLMAFVLFLSMQQVNCAMPAGNDLSTELENAFSNALTTASSLNYFTDKSVTLDVYGNKLTLDWGFAGSGDIFKPLGTITKKISFAEDKSGRTSEAAVIKTLAFNFINKKLRKQANKTDGFKWISDFKFTPIHLLGLKLILLVKEQDVSHIFEEVTSLLFRLSLVDDLSIIDKDMPLTSYLPEALVDVLQGLDLGLPEFINQIWSSIVSNKTVSADLTIQKPVKIEGFVFSNKQLAESAYLQFKNYTDNNFYKDFENFGKDKFSVVDSSEFKKANAEIRTEDELTVNAFAQNLIIYRELLIDDNALIGSKLEEEMIKQIKPLGNNDGIIFVEDLRNGEYWVARVSGDLGVLGAAKSLALTFTRVFKEYVNAKKSLYEGKDAAANQYRAVVEAREASRNNLEKFIRSAEGKPVFDSICKQINALVNVKLDEETKKELLETKSMLTTAIAGLEDLKATKDQIKNRLVLMDKQVPLSLDAEIASTAKQIEAKKTELAEIDTQLNEVNISTAISLDEERLAKLNKIVQDKESKHETVNPKILDMINSLKQKIASSKEEKMNANNIQDKLTVRENVAMVLEQAAARLRTKMETEKKVQEAIVDECDKLILEEQNNELDEQIEEFAKRLDVVAKEIRENSEKAKQLNSLRATNRPSSELDALELEVGHILDSKTHENFIHSLMLRTSMFSEFIKDLINAGNTDVRIMGLKQMIKESVKNILDGSGSVQENLIVLKYAMQYVPTSLKALLRISGAELLVNA